MVLAAGQNRRDSLELQPADANSVSLRVIHPKPLCDYRLCTLILLVPHWQLDVLPLSYTELARHLLPPGESVHQYCSTKSRRDSACILVLTLGLKICLARCHVSQLLCMVFAHAYLILVRYTCDDRNIESRRSSWTRKNPR